MTQSLSFRLETNKTYTGVNNNTGETITFTTGSTCSTNGACAMNGNTFAPSSNGYYYYSWYAATANSSQTSGDALYSICPGKWRLPANYTINPAKSYGSLTNAYNLTINGTLNKENHTTELGSFPLNFTRTGLYRHGILSNDTNNNYGIYWSSTIYDSTFSWSFYYHGIRTSPQENGYKYDGMNVRCVAI